AQPESGMEGFGRRDRRRARAGLRAAPGGGRGAGLLLPRPSGRGGAGAGAPPDRRGPRPLPRGDGAPPPFQRGVLAPSRKVRRPGARRRAPATLTTGGPRRTP